MLSKEAAMITEYLRSARRPGGAYEALTVADKRQFYREGI